MIDYLEQFFLEQEKPLEQLSVSLPGSGAEMEPVMVPAGLQMEPAGSAVSTNQPQSVDVFRNTTVRNVEDTLTNPVQQAAPLPISRPAVEREGEGLERRLRRESRRYDSGFYWY